jgi:ribosomal protein S18 acetylase RimI-like enzyme
MRGAGHFAVRPMIREDFPRVAVIFREAFNELYARRGFGQVVPDASVGIAIAAAYQTLDPEGCLVATSRGEIVGSGFLHPRGRTAGIGPVTVDPAAQGRGAGHALVAELCRRADAAGVRSLRLIQDAFNEASFALYGRAGFVAREALVRSSFRSPRGYADDRSIRRAQASDVSAVIEHEARLVGISRPQDYELLLRTGEVFIAGEPTITGSLARIARGDVAVLGPASAESLDVLVALIEAATSELRPRTDTRLLVPARTPDLLDRLFAMGLEVHSLCTYMVRGEYRPFTEYYVPTLFPESG